MPNYTSRFNLTKPIVTEQYDIAKVTNENADILDAQSSQLLTATETITVGTGGQYATINQALAYATKKYPTYVSASVRPRVTISLLSGFIMAEQVYVDGLDLGWITISSVDAEVVIQRSALVSHANGRYGAFIAINNGILPSINTLFNMDTSGTASARDGFSILYNSKVIIGSGKGVKNAGGMGIYAYRNAIVNAGGAILSGAGDKGIYADQSSIISANSANVSYAYTAGVYATNASTIEFEGGNAQRAGYASDDVTILNASADGIYATNGSTINAKSANASYSTRYGVYSIQSSRINFNYGTATNTGSYSVYVIRNSIVSAQNSNCSTDGSPAEEYIVAYNGQIDISGATGQTDCSPTLNSYTHQGLITNGAGVITTSGSLPLTGGTLTGALNGTSATLKNTLKLQRDLDSSTYFDVSVGDVNTTFNGYDPDGYMKYIFKSNSNTVIETGSDGKLNANYGIITPTIEVTSKLIAEQSMTLALSDETTAITTGTAKITFRSPFAITLTKIPRISLSTASTSGLPTVDINKNGTSIFSTVMTIDANEKTSVTAATSAVLSTTSIADDDELTFDIDVSGTGAKGLKCTIFYKRA